MRVLGIDPSSALSGGAIVDRGNLELTVTWKKNDKRSHPWNLNNFFETAKLWCKIYKPDMACIESLSVARGAQVTRMISFYQAAAVLACKQSGITVIETRVSRARMLVLGNGGLSKEEAHKAVKKLYPKHKFKQFDSGGSDETDAVVLAVAGPDSAES